MTEEIWKPVVNFEGYYEVSNLGHIKRLDSGEFRIAVPVNGYLTVQLWRQGKRHNRYIHLMVLEAFIGPKPEGLEGRHLDSNKDNCRSDNLAWGTSAQNSIDTLVNGNNKQAKLTDEQVRWIRNTKLSRGQVNSVLEQLDISEVTYYNVKSRRTYTHIKDKG